jgi:hypothetical protein
MMHLRLRPIPLLTTFWTIAATGRGLQPSTMRAERPSCESASPIIYRRHWLSVDRRRGAELLIFKTIGCFGGGVRTTASRERRAHFRGVNP